MQAVFRPTGCFSFFGSPSEVAAKLRVLRNLLAISGPFSQLSPPDSEFHGHPSAFRSRMAVVTRMLV